MKSQTWFAIITVYFNDLNITGTPEKLSMSIEHLKKESKMKESWKNKVLLWLTNLTFSR